MLSLGIVLNIKYSMHYFSFDDKSQLQEDEMPTGTQEPQQLR